MQIKRLVIVESPAKARTISQFLGTDYLVESSIGHIRDLPSSAAQIPKKYKKESWARLGVNIGKDFQPLYVVPPDKKKTVTTLKNILKEVDEVYLATDEDREGEAIAWHLLQELKPKVPVHRMVFHEITSEAIQAALDNTRSIDENLVEAQETRRILDRLVGYEISPVLWKKVKPRLSAGRVQSVVVRLIVEQERKRMNFVRSNYWGVETSVSTTSAKSDLFSAKLIEINNLKIATGRDFNSMNGELNDKNTVVLVNEDIATNIASELTSASLKVSDLRERPFTQNPPAPFITSTLQQEAARKLRYSTQRTMQIAQRLYENGYITYMRTDSTNLSEQAINAARAQIKQMYGNEYLPASARRHKISAKAAQEAHEAIRPSGEIFRTPENIKNNLDQDAFQLYELIWKRTIASQMQNANGMRTQVRLNYTSPEYGELSFQSSGKVILFPGFLRAYVEGSDDPEAALDDQERILPTLQLEQELPVDASSPTSHETQAPNRWTEASLVRELEERGIGRPSTYASIIQTIQDRGYVWKKGSTLIPTFMAFATTRLLEGHFPELIDYEFTARMETHLDAIAQGDKEGRPWLHNFYFGDDNIENTEPRLQKGLHETISMGWEDIDARSICSVPIGKNGDGEPIVVRVGRFGTQIQEGENPKRADLPLEIPPDEITIDVANKLLSEAKLADLPLGDHPNGTPIYLKTGRYGPYVQLGEDPERDEKGKIKKDAIIPKRSSLWDGLEMNTITLEDALELLSYPRVIGIHPLNETKITVQDGPNGPYLKCGDENRSLNDIEHMKNINLDEAVALLAEPRRRRGQRASKQIIAELGQHPNGGGTIQIRNGRFGPYVTDGTVNASIPNTRDPQKIELEDAINLLAAREERLRSEGKDPRSTTTKRKK